MTVTTQNIEGQTVALPSKPDGCPVWTKINVDLWIDQYDNMIQRRADGVNGIEFWGFGPRGSSEGGVGRKIVRIAKSMRAVKDDLECQSPALRALIALRATLEARHGDDRDFWLPYVTAVERAL